MSRTHDYYADSMLRSQIKFMGFTLEFHVHLISPEPFEGFSLNFTQMFLSVYWRAEPLTQLCKLSQDHTSKSLDSVGEIWLSFRLLSCFIWPY